ncbi:MAG: polysaccharide biosynthesis tyrosine autokinase [Actinomycetota bacterium]|nr:polysaccharide biosynthesis tyrosine autokinase [Actinomycetota bacterium]
MELSQYLQAFRTHWKLVFTMTLIGIAAAGALTLLLTPQYASSAQLYITTSGTETNSAQANIVAQDKVPSYALLATTSDFAQRALTAAGVDGVPPGELVSKIEATVPVPDAGILQITVTDDSPQRAQTLVNAIATQMVEYIREVETPAPFQITDANGVVTTTTPNPDYKATVTQTGNVSGEPLYPDPMLNLPLGAIVGLLLGLVLALIRFLMDNTVKSSKQIEELTGATSIGGVLYDADMASRPLVTQHKAQSITSEAYRQIRTNLQYVSVDNPPKVMVVTSSVSGEGKTTTAINLALVLAQSGQRVALVEADLRRPRVMRYLQLVGGAGLTNVLAGKADLAELLQPWGDGKLSVLAAGPNPPNPSELLGSEQMGHLLDELRSTHDYVVIDAPPLLPVTDGAVLAVLADGVVIVTRYGRTRREQLRAAAAMVRVIDVRVLGTVLNMIPPKGGGGDYGYGYGYGYGYAYEPDPSPRELISSRKERGRRARGRTTKDLESSTNAAIAAATAAKSHHAAHGASAATDGTGAAVNGTEAAPATTAKPADAAASGTAAKRESAAASRSSAPE